MVEDGSIYIGNDPSGSTDTAQYNLAVGTTALDAVTSGDFNVAVGYDALTSNTTGSNNTASGLQALYSNISGIQNTASGLEALYSNIGGSYNTASGIQALFSNTEGNRNTAIGSFGLADNTTGNYNTAIGYNSDVGKVDLTNATAIGNGAIVTASNTMQLGNTSVTNVKTSGSVTAGAITIPNTDGDQGDVLTTDGSGQLGWQAPNGQMDCRGVGNWTEGICGALFCIYDLDPNEYCDQCDPDQSYPARVRMCLEGAIDFP